jgi:hypothetical protein
MRDISWWTYSLCVVRDAYCVIGNMIERIISRGGRSYHGFCIIEEGGNAN